MLIDSLVQYSPALGIFGLIVAGVIFFVMQTHPDGNEKMREIASANGTTIEQLVAAAACEKVSAMLGDTDYLKRRAARGSREKFLRVLAQVPDVPSEPHDKLN